MYAHVPAAPTADQITETEEPIAAAPPPKQHPSRIHALVYAITIIQSIILITMLTNTHDLITLHAPHTRPLSLSIEHTQWLENASQNESALATRALPNAAPPDTALVARLLAHSSASYIASRDPRTAWRPPQRENAIPLLVPCQSTHTTATLITYVRMYTALRGNTAHIYLLTQTDGQPFNRGALLNVAVVRATTDHPRAYVCTHSTDALPLATHNAYAEPGRNAVRRLRGSGPLLGAAFCADPAALRACNGFPNDFFGDGTESGIAAEWRARNVEAIVLEDAADPAFYDMAPHTIGIKDLQIFSYMNRCALERDIISNPACATTNNATQTDTCFTAHGGLHNIAESVRETRVVQLADHITMLEVAFHMRTNHTPTC